MQFQIKEEKINSLLSILSIVFASVVVILLCVVLISSNNFRTLPYKEYYDAVMVTCYFLSWIIAIFVVYRIVKYKNQNEIYLPFGIFGVIGVIIAMRLTDKDKAKHDRQKAALNNEFGSRPTSQPMRESSYSSGPPSPPPPPPPPREEIINAKSIQVVTTDGKIYNIKTGNGDGESGLDTIKTNDAPPPPRFERPSSPEPSYSPLSRPMAAPKKPTFLGKYIDQIKSKLPKMPRIPLPKIPFFKMRGGIKMNNWGTWFRIPRLRLKPLSKQAYFDEATFSLDPKSRLQKGNYVRKTRAQDNIGQHESRFRSMKKQENIWGPDDVKEDE